MINMYKLFKHIKLFSIYAALTTIVFSFTLSLSYGHDVDEVYIKAQWTHDLIYQNIQVHFDIIIYMIHGVILDNH